MLGRSALLLALSGIAGAAAAEPERSLRPEARPVPVAAAPVALRPTARPGTQVGPVAERPGVLPEARPVVPPEVSTEAHRDPGFVAWVAAFRPRALAAGVSAQVFDTAFETARFDPDIVARDRNQAEFSKPIWDYLASAVSESRIENGRAALADHRELFERIEERYRVDEEVVAAIWGMESAYGTRRGDLPIVSSLATLAYEGRRAGFFEEQLVTALGILQSGDVAPEDFTGSWAGAMGHTQFIPTSWDSLAVDFDGDGKRNIWSDDPTDALASTAAYLARYDWVLGQPWGVEVQLPDGFDYSLARRDETRLPSDWARLGVTDMDGKAVRDHAEASILLPAGAEGAAFMIFPNFRAIERYNAADAYVIGVGHLSDRLKGMGPIRADWPLGDRALSFSERQEMQRLLTAQGFDTQGVDGRIGPLTAEAIRAFQRSRDMAPDGYASLRVLDALR